VDPGKKLPQRKIAVMLLVAGLVLLTVVRVVAGNDGLRGGFVLFGLASLRDSSDMLAKGSVELQQSYEPILVYLRELYRLLDQEVASSLEEINLDVDDVPPKLDGILSLINNQIVPGVGEMKAEVDNEIIPHLSSSLHGSNNVILPGLREMKAVADQEIVPRFNSALALSSNYILPDLRKLEIAVNDIVPRYTGLLDQIEKIVPVLDRMKNAAHEMRLEYVNTLIPKNRLVYGRVREMYNNIIGAGGVPGVRRALVNLGDPAHRAGVTPTNTTTIFNDLNYLSGLIDPGANRSLFLDLFVRGKMVDGIHFGLSEVDKGFTEKLIPGYDAIIFGYTSTEAIDGQIGLFEALALMNNGLGDIIKGLGDIRHGFVMNQAQHGESGIREGLTLMRGGLTDLVGPGVKQIIQGFVQTEEKDGETGVIEGITLMRGAVVDLIGPGLGQIIQGFVQTEAKDGEKGILEGLGLMHAGFVDLISPGLGQIIQGFVQTEAKDGEKGIIEGVTLMRTGVSNPDYNPDDPYSSPGLSEGLQMASQGIRRDAMGGVNQMIEGIEAKIIPGLDEMVKGVRDQLQPGFSLVSIVITVVTLLSMIAVFVLNMFLSGRPGAMRAGKKVIAMIAGIALFFVLPAGVSAFLVGEISSAIFKVQDGIDQLLGGNKLIDDGLGTVKDGMEKSLVAEGIELMKGGIDDKLVPGIDTLVDAVTGLIVPGLREIDTGVNNDVIPGINTLLDAINNLIVPGLREMKAGIDGELLPGLETLLAASNNQIVPGIRDMKRGIENDIIGGLNTILEGVNGLIRPGLDSMVKGLDDQVNPPKDGFISGLGSMRQGFLDLRTGFNDIYDAMANPGGASDGLGLLRAILGHPATTSAYTPSAPLGGVPPSKPEEWTWTSVCNDLNYLYGQTHSWLLAWWYGVGDRGPRARRVIGLIRRKLDDDGFNNDGIYGRLHSMRHVVDNVMIVQLRYDVIPQFGKRSGGSYVKGPLLVSIERVQQIMGEKAPGFTGFRGDLKLLVEQMQAFSSELTAVRNHMSGELLPPVPRLHNNFTRADGFVDNLTKIRNSFVGEFNPRLDLVIEAFAHATGLAANLSQVHDRLIREVNPRLNSTIRGFTMTTTAHGGPGMIEGLNMVRRDLTNPGYELNIGGPRITEKLDEVREVVLVNVVDSAMAAQAGIVENIYPTLQAMKAYVEGELQPGLSSVSGTYKAAGLVISLLSFSCGLLIGRIRGARQVRRSAML